MKLQIVFEPSEEGGYTAIVPALPGCLSEGDTREEALANIEESHRALPGADLLESGNAGSLIRLGSRF